MTVKEAQILSLGFGAHGLEAETTQGTLAAPAVVLATGAQRRRPRIPGLDDFDGAGVSYCAVCDGFFLPWQGGGRAGRRDLCAPRGGRFATPGKAGDPPHQRGPGAGGASSGLGPGHPADSSPGRRIRHFVRSSVRRRRRPGGVPPVCSLGNCRQRDLARKVGLLTENGKIVVDGTMATNVPVFCRRGLHRRPPQVATAVAQGAQAGLSAVRYLQNR